MLHLRAGFLTCVAPLGFTLAEVLVTLGIIGIVAALTMPALVADYQKQALKTQFKKQYSVYSQNLQKNTMIDFDSSVRCYYPSLRNGVTGDIVAILQTNTDCKDFFDKFAENMKVIKTCSGNALADGCVPKYASYPTNSGCTGFLENYINNLNTAYVLADGSILIPYHANNYPLFAFDINGMKGPNKPGHDLFATNIARDINTGGYYFGSTRNDETAPINTSITSCLSAPDPLFTTLEDIYE